MGPPQVSLRPTGADTSKYSANFAGLWLSVFVMHDGFFIGRFSTGNTNPNSYSFYLFFYQAVSVPVIFSTFSGMAEDSCKVISSDCALASDSIGFS
jgi:hypothetical protein